MRGDAKKKAVASRVEMCFLEPVLHQSVETLSKGYRHRTCFAQSIIHDPDVLVLDEPTDGLDPNQKHEMRSLIRRMGEKKAIIFSTHILEEVDAVCSRAIIIDRGRIVANGTPAELRQKSEWAGAVTLRVSGVERRDGELKSYRNLATRKRATILKEEATRVTARVFPKTNGNGALARSIADAAQGWRIEELHTEEGRLDEVSGASRCRTRRNERTEILCYEHFANIKTITKRELGAYFSSPLAYVFHRDLSAAVRVFHFFRRRIFRSGRGRSRASVL